MITINMWHIYLMSGSIFDMYIDFHGRYLVYVSLRPLFLFILENIPLGCYFEDYDTFKKRLELLHPMSCHAEVTDPLFLKIDVLLTVHRSISVK
jgi:hypothetical protein